MVKQYRRALLLTLAAALVLGCSAREGGYKISEQTPADFISWQSGPKDLVYHDGKDCSMPAPFDGDAYDYLAALVKAGDRRSGTRECRCGELFIRDTLSYLGYRVKEVSYTFPYYRFDPDATRVVRKRDGKEFKAYPMHYSMPAPGPRVGKLKRPHGDLTGCFVYIAPKMFLSGNITEKYKEWQDKGALGIIREASLEPLAAKGLIHSARAHSTSWHYAPLPGFVVENAHELIGEVIEVSDDTRIVAGEGRTVVARSAEDAESYVLVTAHLDSWFQGALDDGSGSATLMEIARLMKDDSRGVIFVAADSEEIGLIGSAAYVMQADMDKIKAVLELDMVSSLNNYTSDVPEGANVMPRIITVSDRMKPLAKSALSGLEGRKAFVSVELNREVMGGLSTDMEWFYAFGIPGVFIYTPSEYYHTQRDTLEWIPKNDIQEVAKASADLVRKLRDADSLPKPSKVVPFDFSASMDGDSVIFEVRPKNGMKKSAKVLVRCYFEDGFEDKVDLERGDDGSFKGEFVPPFPGKWQFLAIVSDGGKYGKRWFEVTLPDVQPAGR